MKTTDYSQKILRVAEKLMQTQGYNGFSYKDIANEVGIKTSSIHYYFPTKADLGKAVLKNHAEEIYIYLNEVQLDTKLTSKQKLSAFFDGVFSKTYLDDKRMCLGGMLASDLDTLPSFVQDEIKNFFEYLENWLENILMVGKKQNEFVIGKSVKEESMLIIAALEGTLLLARLYGDINRLEVLKMHTLQSLRNK